MNARRTLELELGPVGPWSAYVRIWVLEHRGRRRSSLPADFMFEVHAAWTGPPAVGFPPSDRPVAAADTYTVAALEDARTLARRAAEAFAAGGDYPPDLRELATGKPAAEQGAEPRLWLPK